MSYMTSFINKDCEIRSYLLGYFLADGHYTGNSVEIQSGDKQIIYDLARAIEYDNKIYEDKRENNTYYKIGLSGPFANFIRILGFTNIKTGNEFIPECVLPETMNHFFRGLIDGDGCLDITEKNKGYFYFRLRLCSGSNIFLENCSKKLGEIVEREVKAYKYKHAKCWTLQYNHYDSLKLCEYLYNNSTIQLLRKKETYLFAKTNMGNPQLLKNYRKNFTKK